MALMNRQQAAQVDRLPKVDNRWKERAACRAIAPDLFFPLGSTGDAVGQITAAKAVCRACSVRSECLQFALETNQEAGVWGETSEEERRTMRRTWRVGRRAPGALPS